MRKRRATQLWSNWPRKDMIMVWDYRKEAWLQSCVHVMWYEEWCNCEEPSHKKIGLWFEIVGKQHGCSRTSASNLHWNNNYWMELHAWLKHPYCTKNNHNSLLGQKQKNPQCLGCNHVLECIMKITPKFSIRFRTKTLQTTRMLLNVFDIIKLSWWIRFLTEFHDGQNLRIHNGHGFIMWHDQWPWLTLKKVFNFFKIS